MGLTTKWIKPPRLPARGSFATTDTLREQPPPSE